MLQILLFDLDIICGLPFQSNTDKIFGWEDYIGGEREAIKSKKVESSVVTVVANLTLDVCMAGDTWQATKIGSYN